MLPLAGEPSGMTAAASLIGRLRSPRSGGATVMNSVAAGSRSIAAPTDWARKVLYATPDEELAAGGPRRRAARCLCRMSTGLCRGEAVWTWPRMFGSLIRLFPWAESRRRRVRRRN
jgi:hypothetical protein